MPRRRVGWMALLLALASCGGGHGSTSSTSSESSRREPSRPVVPDGRRTTIERIVDGDTVVVAGNETVRLIGIDTPETKDPRRPVQCFGAEATRHITDLIPPGTAVVLVRDVSTTDRFGRTLSYLYRTEDGVFVNALMVKSGYAAAATFPPDVAHADELVRLERAARDADRGLWSACGEVGVPVRT